MTFGEPRVGNFIFAENLDRLVPNTYRVVHRADIIPHSPPCSPDGAYKCKQTNLKAYYHHGTEVWYDNDMHYGASFTVSIRKETSVCKSHRYYFLPAATF